MEMNRKPGDSYYDSDGYLVFANKPTEFDSILLATQAAERTIRYATEHGHTGWGIMEFGYSVIPCGGAENAAP